MYELHVEIVGCKNEGAVIAALSRLWSFTFDSVPGDPKGTFNGCGTGSIGGGMTEGEVARKIAWAAWRANGAHCRVTVRALCLEDPNIYNYDDPNEYLALRSQGLLTPEPVEEEAG